MISHRRPEVAPIRILAIAPTSFFADYGCHVRIRSHLVGLRARGHDILLVTYPSGRNLAQIPTVRAPWPAPSPIQVGSSRLKLALDAILGPTALAAALRFRPQILHGYLHEGALIGAGIRAILGLPLVFDFQGSLTSEMLDHGFLSARSVWLRPLQRLERWINDRPDVILTSSHHAARLLAAAPLRPAGLQGPGQTSPGSAVPGRHVDLPLPHVIALPDSIDPEHFRPAAAFDHSELAALRARLDIPPDRRLIVYLGLLARYQGTDLLLQAMARLVSSPAGKEAQAHGDVHLLLMGLPFVEYYRGMVQKLGLDGRVTLTGPVPYERAPAHLALGQIAVAPKLSATESSGKVLAYMATGLPVAAFDTPVHREYMQDLGVYAAAGDADALAQALDWLLANPQEAEARGRALRDRIQACYTWEETAALIESVYQRVCRLSPGPRGAACPDDVTGAGAG